MNNKDELFDKKNEIEEAEEYDPEIYTLTDEDDNELHFALLGTLEHEGNVYKALVPVNEDGEDILCAIEDEDELESVYNLIMDELYAEEEEDEE